MRTVTASCLFLSAALMAGLTAQAAAQTGPVARNCTKEIAQFCANKGHSADQTRTCLQENRKSLSPACSRALDTTGPRHLRPR